MPVTHDPIQEQHRAKMLGAIMALMEAFPGLGVCLFVFDADPDGHGRANYVSNTQRAETVGALRTWLAQQDAAPPA